MKNTFLILCLLFAYESIAGCTSPISRSNVSANAVLTSTKYNTDLNTVYTKVNDLGGDCITDETISTAKLADGAVTQDKLAAGVLATFVPAGAIIAWAGSTAPAGYLLCDGSQVSRTTYADLYAVVSTSFGSGNGSTTFHLPDLRGRFLRMKDGGTGRDPNAATRTAINTGGAVGDNVGSLQGEAFKSHTHSVFSRTGTDVVGGGSAEIFMTSAFDNATDATEAAGGDETRPINVYVNYIIKY